MKKKILKEGTHEYIEELLRNVFTQISHLPNYEEEIKTLSNPQFRESHCKSYPDCYLNLRYKDGKTLPYFFICNTYGVVDPKIIEFSLNLATKMKEKFEHEFDQGDIETNINKLKNLFNKYSKSEVTSFSMAARKGHVTRDVNSMVQYKKDLFSKKD
jgi:hypothetical protein